MIRAVVVLFVFCGLSHGETVAQLNAKIDSLGKVAHALRSAERAVEINAMFQADATLSAKRVRILPGANDSTWVNIDFPLGTATSVDAVKILIAMEYLRQNHNARNDKEVAGRVYVRWDRAKEAISGLKDILR